MLQSDPAMRANYIMDWTSAREENREGLENNVKTPGSLPRWHNTVNDALHCFSRNTTRVAVYVMDNPAADYYVMLL